MTKLYGQAVRKEAGVTKTIRRVAQSNSSLLKGVVEVSGTVEKVFDETAEALEEFLHRCQCFRLLLSLAMTLMVAYKQLRLSCQALSTIRVFCSSRVRSDSLSGVQN